MQKELLTKGITVRNHPSLRWLFPLWQPKIWRSQSANITSPISRTGRTTPPSNAPSPAEKKLCPPRLANEKRWRATAFQDASARFVNFRQREASWTAPVLWRFHIGPAKQASANETERGSVSRSISDLQTLQFIPNTFCPAELLRVADPRSILKETSEESLTFL